MASCTLFKKSTMKSPLPAVHNPAANPGEFGLLDNDDGTLTLVIVDQAGNPSPIDPGAASMTVTSDAPNIVGIADLQGFTWSEYIMGGPPATTTSHPTQPVEQHPPTTLSKVPSKVTPPVVQATPQPTSQSTPTTPSKTTPQPTQPVVQHPPSTNTLVPRPGATANITAVVTWTGGSPGPNTLTWKDTVAADSAGALTIERGTITVK